MTSLSLYVPYLMPSIRLHLLCSPAKGPKATGRRTAAAVAAGNIAAAGKATAAALDDAQLVSISNYVYFTPLSILTAILRLGTAQQRLLRNMRR